jgi:polysaccharide biosynthesis transport protein
MSTQSDLASPGLDYGEPETGGGLNIRRLLAAVFRYKWLVLLVTILGSVVGVVGSSFIKPEYTAQATVWIETTGQRRASLAQPLQSAELLQSYAWVDLLRSYAVLDQVVMERRLFVEPADPDDRPLFRSFTLADDFQPGEYRLAVDGRGAGFTLKGGSGTEVQRGRVGDPIGQPAGFEWQPPPSELRPGRTIAFEVSKPRDAAQRLSGNLNARLDRNGNFLRIQLSGTNPEEIASALNSVLEQFVELAATLKREKVDELEGILAQQLEHAEQYLRNAELALEGFRVQTITLPTEEGPYSPGPGLDMTRATVFNRFFDRKLQQEELRQDRQAIQRALVQIRDGAEVPVMALELIGSVAASTELRQALSQLTERRAELRAVRGQYTDEHPLVISLLGQIETLERQTIPALGENVIRNIAAREAELGSMVESASGELRSIPPRMSDEARLRRQVATAEGLYTNLRRSYEEARLASLTAIPDIRILDRATEPRWPVKDDRPRVLLFALFGSLGLGLVGAVLLDRIDPRLHYPEQVGQLGLVSLGAIPHVGNGKRTGRVDPQVIEAFRGLRLNVAYSYGSAGPVLLTVSSPGPGDGKSFVSMNLAAAFAQAGHRTLLIDGDIRRGALHQAYGRSRKPGLTDYLKRNAGWDDVLQATRNPSLSLIGAGTRHQDGPELLGSSAMGELLSAGLQARFGVIVVDSPPLGAGVDPLILATWTRNLLLVLRTGNTNREMAGLKLDMVSRLPIRLLGGVLNDVPASGVYRYYSYASGYEVASESADGGGRQDMRMIDGGTPRKPRPLTEV